MITRVEISGFKTFTDFSVDLAPLSVIAGANASGKSNFLDALRVIKAVTTGKTLATALAGRGRAADFFTKIDNGKNSKSIFFAVELLIPPTLQHGSKELQLKATRFRYEVGFFHDPTKQNFFVVGHERLLLMDEENDPWVHRHFLKLPLINVVRYPSKHQLPLIDHQIRWLQEGTDVFLHGGSNENFQNTQLSIANDHSDVHLSAVRSYFDNLDYIDLLDPQNFSNFEDSKVNDSLIFRELKDLGENHPEDLHLLSMRVSTIAKPIHQIKVTIDDFDRLTLFAEQRNGSRYLVSSLSEGTLRTIALTTLLFSKAQQRTILLEEPENGIDPRVLAKFVELLLDLATDLKEDVPLIQIICTTHSPALLEMIVETDATEQASGYLASIRNKVVQRDGEKVFQEATDILPIIRDIKAPIAESRLERATLGQAKRYMSCGSAKELNDV
jgi:predicted ATPase